MFYCPGNQCEKVDQIFFLWDEGIVVTTTQMDLDFKREPWELDLLAPFKSHQIDTYLICHCAGALAATNGARY